MLHISMFWSGITKGYWGGPTSGLEWKPNMCQPHVPLLLLLKITLILTMTSTSDSSVYWTEERYIKMINNLREIMHCAVQYGRDYYYYLRGNNHPPLKKKVLSKQYVYEKTTGWHPKFTCPKNENLNVVNLRHILVKTSETVWYRVFHNTSCCTQSI